MSKVLFHTTLLFKSRIRKGANIRSPFRPDQSDAIYDTIVLSYVYGMKWNGARWEMGDEDG